MQVTKKEVDGLDESGLENRKKIERNLLVTVTVVVVGASYSTLSSLSQALSVSTAFAPEGRRRLRASLASLGQSFPFSLYSV